MNKHSSPSDTFWLLVSDTLHIIGAGLAGLACAVKAAPRSRVVVYEASPAAGGRCRSFMDQRLGQIVDNGSHLMLGAYDQTRTYLKLIGGENLISTFSPATFPFFQLDSGKIWHLRMNRGPLPYWLFDGARRAPGSRPLNYIRDVWSLCKAPEEQTVAQALASSPLYSNLWEPFTLAVLNTAAPQASARLLWAAVKRTLMRGEKACRPLLAQPNLDAALVAPALCYLERHRAEIRFGTLLKNLKITGNRITSLSFSSSTVTVEPGDKVILAVPAPMAQSLVPALAVPISHNVIINVHFSFKGRKPPLPATQPFLGLTAGTAHWLFQGKDLLSATISDAQKMATMPAPALAALIWKDVTCATTPEDQSLPLYRILKEKRATFAQTPAENARRPACQTEFVNLWLAGDWTDTGLPATIEGAVQSGFLAAELSKKG